MAGDHVDVLEGMISAGELVINDAGLGGETATVYDAEGYPQGDVYNINSAFAVPDEDGFYTIHFGGDKDAVNYMDIFEGWNIALRIYEPTEAYFNGEWVMPELVLVE